VTGPFVERALLVLHDIGDEAGGGPWREAFVAAGWVGDVVAPDLPGHAGAPPPLGGDHESGDGAFVAVRALAAAGVERGSAVCVGVGVNGWSAQLHGLGRRASAVVLVDGLGGPWMPIRERVLAGAARLRAIADDPESVAPMPAGATLDPRLHHRLPTHGSRKMAFEVAPLLPVPVVVVETPASATPADDAERLAALMGAGGSLVRLDDTAPATVAAATLAAFAQFPPA
jgi:pimeloyl-ACP methyl ester carboxylesterase